MKKMKLDVGTIAAVVSAGIAVAQFARDSQDSVSTPPAVIVYMVQDCASPGELSSIDRSRSAPHAPRVVHARPAVRDPEPVAAD